MLRIIVPGDEHFDDESQEIFTVGDVALELEHSLVSVSKWEEKYERAFLSKEIKTTAEVLDYIYFMILTPGVSQDIVAKMSQENFEEIQKYIDAKRSATYISEDRSTPANSETVTSELIYYWMITAGIDTDAQYWHLNRLFMLLRVIDRKNSKPKKRSFGEAAADRRARNEQRKRELGTTG